MYHTSHSCVPDIRIKRRALFRDSANLADHNFTKGCRTVQIPDCIRRFLPHTLLIKDKMFSAGLRLQVSCNQSSRRLALLSPVLSLLPTISPPQHNRDKRKYMKRNGPIRTLSHRIQKSHPNPSSEGVQEQRYATVRDGAANLRPCGRRLGC